MRARKQVHILKTNKDRGGREKKMMFTTASRSYTDSGGEIPSTNSSFGGNT